MASSNGISIEAIYKNIADVIYPSRKYDINTLSIELAGVFNYFLFLKKCNLEDITLDKITEFITWRRTCIPMDLNPDIILNCNVLDVYKRIPVCHFGYDKTYKPVIYFLFSCHNSHEALKLTTTSHLLDYDIWQNDAINELCYYQSLSTGTFVTSAVLVVDIGGLEMPFITPEFMHLLSRRAEINGKYYPYLFDRIFIVNAIEGSEATVLVKSYIQALASPYCMINVVTTSTNDPSTCKKAATALAEYIPLAQLPTEYGGTSGRSIFLVTHPFQEVINNRENSRKSTVSSTVFSKLEQAESEDYNVFQREISMDMLSVSQYSTSNIAVSSTTPSVNNFSPSPLVSSRHFISNNNNRVSTIIASSPSIGAGHAYIQNRLRTRSVSTAPESLTTPFGDTKADYILYNNIYFPPISKAILSIFVDFYSGNNIPKSPLFIDLTKIITTEDSALSTTSISNTTPNMSNNIEPSMPSSHSISSLQTSTVSNMSSEHGPAPSTPSAMVNPITMSSPAAFTLAECTQTELKLNIKTKIYSVLLDGVLETSIGDGDRLVIRTTTGALSLRVGRSAATSTTPGIAPSVATTNSTNSYPGVYSNISQKSITYQKYYGNFTLSNGQLYKLSRGAFLCGWLQKWPMESQSFGSYTHRYFILDNALLRYWKTPPESVVDINERTPPRGSLTLTSKTTVTRSKTFLGSQIIIIKSEFDELTLCAYSQVDDYAWYNEIHHAIERVKAKESENEDGAKYNPEIMWCQPDPNCIAVCADVLDMSKERDSIMDIPNANRFINTSFRDDSNSQVLSYIQYVVLCRINTGISCLHSVQIGPDENASIRLENNDLELGIRLQAIRICGDLLIVSGTNGYVGCGRIPQWQPAVMHQKHVTAPSSRHIYIRRLWNSNHTPDSVVKVLSSPRYSLQRESNLFVDDEVPDRNKPYTRPSLGTYLLASGDDSGCVCIWKSDINNNGSISSASSALSTHSRGAINSSSNKTGWLLVHSVHVWSKVNSISFSCDGNYMAVATSARVVLFDLSCLNNNNNITKILSSNISSPLSKSSSNNFSTPYAIGVRSVVLDDCIGYNLTDVFYAVDLSSLHKVKLWKISQGLDMDYEDNRRSVSVQSTTTSHNAMINSNFSTPRQSSKKSNKSQQSVSYTDHSDIDRSQMYGSDRIQWCEMHIGTLFSRDKKKMIYFTSLFSQKSDNRNVVDTHTLHMMSTRGFDEEDQGRTSGIVEHEDSHIDDGDHVGANEKTLDTSFYSEDLVVSSLRIHLRDWWCDYSTRYLLLGHSRIISLCKFDGNLSTGDVNVLDANTAFAINSALNAKAESIAASTNNGTNVSQVDNLCLDRPCSNMFWSTVYSALGRRLIARCNVCYRSPPIDNNTERVNIFKSIESYEFVISIVNGLHSSLGDEYMQSILTYWKFAALDLARNILEDHCGHWFRDITFFSEFQRRLQLSPDLVLSSIQDLKSCMERCIALNNTVSTDSYDDNHSTTNNTNCTTNNNIISDMDVYNIFNMLQSHISCIYDKEGMTHAIPTECLLFLTCHGVGNLNTAKLLSKHDKLDAKDMLRWLVIGPLIHLERTEPFAVLFCITGLRNYPSYIVNHLKHLAATPPSIPPVAGTVQRDSELYRNLTSIGASFETLMENSDKSNCDWEIEELVSLLAYETPPWIRFILGNRNE